MDSVATERKRWLSLEQAEQTLASIAGEFPNEDLEVCLAQVRRLCDRAEARHVDALIRQRQELENGLAAIR
jgi:hypothetical protein